MKPVSIPRRIDEPPHLLIWSADELGPMLIGLVFGVIIGEAMICLILGLLVTNLYRRFRDNHPDGYIFHLIYWLGLLSPKSRVMVNPYIRRFFP